MCSRVSVCVREAKCRTTLKTLLHLAPQGALYPSRSKSKSNFASVCSVIVSVLVKLTISTSDSSNKNKNNKPQGNNYVFIVLHMYVWICIQTALRALFRIFFMPFLLACNCRSGNGRVQGLVWHGRRALRGFLTQTLMNFATRHVAYEQYFN